MGRRCANPQLDPLGHFQNDRDGGKIAGYRARLHAAPPRQCTKNLKTLESRDFLESRRRLGHSYDRAAVTTGPQLRPGHSYDRATARYSEKQLGARR